MNMTVQTIFKNIIHLEAKFKSYCISYKFILRFSEIVHSNQTAILYIHQKIIRTKL